MSKPVGDSTQRPAHVEIPAFDPHKVLHPEVTDAD